MKRVGFLIIFIVFFTSSVYSQNLYLEFNQMMGLKLGVDIPITESTGFKGALGTSIFSIKTIVYQAVVYYKLPQSTKNFDFYIDLGLPLGYLDLWEERYVDWDKYIDSPYAGWLTGVVLRTTIKKHFSVNTGISFWSEWQEGDGIKHGIIPLVSLAYFL